MPTLQEPTQGEFGLNASVNFFSKAKKDVFAYVNFAFYQANTDVPATANFQYSHDTTATVTFGATGFIYSIPANVTFQTFSASAALSASVTFPNYWSVPANVEFFQPEEFSLLASLIFDYGFDINAAATFLRKNFMSLPAYVFLGQLVGEVLASATFVQSSKTDFQSAIQIQQVSVQKGGNFGNGADFPASMQIIGDRNVNVSASVYFRTPPFDIDIPANVRFGQSNVTDFSATLSVSNNQLGISGVGVKVQQGSGATLVTVQTDATGFFVIDNLVPGDYIVVPEKDGFAFNPPSYNVTITNQNVELFFNMSGQLINEIQTGSTLPPPPEGDACAIDTSSGNAGTFSIEGYIVPDKQNTYNNLLTIVSDENIAAQFRQNLNL